MEDDVGVDDEDRRGGGAEAGGGGVADVADRSSAVDVVSQIVLSHDLEYFPLLCFSNEGFALQHLLLLLLCC